MISSRIVWAAGGGGAGAGWDWGWDWVWMRIGGWTKVQAGHGIGRG